jgi:hypothetical protein
MIMTLECFSGKEYEELRRLALFGLLIPPTTVWAERAFSIMKLIKSERRSRLGEEMMEALICVKVNHPDELTEEERERAINTWVCRGRRTGVHDRKLLIEVMEFEKKIVEDERRGKQQVQDDEEEEEEEEDIVQRPEEEEEGEEESEYERQENEEEDE